MVEAVIKAAIAHTRNMLYSQWNGFDFEIERDDADEDWYIRVSPTDDSYLYDGWWRDSADKSLREAVAEALVGSGVAEQEAGQHNDGN